MRSNDARLLRLTHTRLLIQIALSKPIASVRGGGKAPRLSEVHCDRDSVCVKTDTIRSRVEIFSIEFKVLWCKEYVIEGLVFTRNN